MNGFDDLTEQDQTLARRLQRHLQTSEASLDYVTATRLRAARARALDGSSGTRRGGWLLASGGLTAAVAVAALLLTHGPLAPHASSGGGAVPGAPASIDVLSDELDPDFYEDLELYRWLDRSHDGAV